MIPPAAIQNQYLTYPVRKIRFEESLFSPQIFYKIPCKNIIGFPNYTSIETTVFQTLIFAGILEKFCM